jgi:hypothetical protein
MGVREENGQLDQAKRGCTNLLPPPQIWHAARLRKITRGGARLRLQARRFRSIHLFHHARRNR